QTDAFHRQPVVEAGETRIEYVAILMQRVLPAGAAIPFQTHAVGQSPPIFGTHTPSRLQTAGGARLDHEAVSHATLLGETAQLKTLVTHVCKRPDTCGAKVEQPATLQGT